MLLAIELSWLLKRGVHFLLATERSRGQKQRGKARVKDCDKTNSPASSIPTLHFPVSLRFLLSPRYVLTSVTRRWKRRRAHCPQIWLSVFPISFSVSVWHLQVQIKKYSNTCSAQSGCILSQSLATKCEFTRIYIYIYIYTYVHVYKYVCINVYIYISSSSSSSLLSTLKIARRQKSRGVDSDRANLD